MVSKLALGAIWGYQQYLSPRKGFRCAHAVLHGGTGCSGYAKYAIRDHGIWGAWPKIRQRFRDCKTASATLRETCAVHSQGPWNADEHAEQRRSRKKKSGDGWIGSCCGTMACEGAAAPLGCLGGAARSAPKKGIDFNPCDGDVGIGNCDCASCSPGGCDCGGCDCSPSCG